MAGSLNRVTLIGNLGKDPEIRQMQNGKEVATFSVATSESWKGQDGERQEKTTWHNVVIFSEGLVKVAKQYLSKGSRLMVEGQLQNRKWTDKDGNDRNTTEILLQGFDSKLIMLSGGKGGEAEAAPQRQQPPVADLLDEDSIPF